MSNENIYNEFARMGYTEEQSQKLCELAIKYPSTIQETNQNELLEAMIKALSFHNDKLNDLERLTEFMNKETIKTQIEEWFCDADCEDGMFAVAELYALLYSEAKRNLRCWSDTYEKIEDEEQSNNRICKWKFNYNTTNRGESKTIFHNCCRYIKWRGLQLCSL